MATILVTGGAGYIGSICAARLVDLGHSVAVVDDLSAGYAEAVPAGAAFQRLDVGNRAALAALLHSRRFDVVFHFAAKASIPESVTNPGPFFNANVASGIAMLETLRKAGIRKFIFSSSAAVYGPPEAIPVSEEHPARPINAYGETKSMLERALEWYARAYEWSVIAFRYFNAAGAVGLLGENHRPETHIIPRLLEVAFGKRRYFEIYGDDYRTSDGTCVRDYVHVLDIAEAHVLGLQHLNGPGMRVYNIGTGTGYTVREVCRAVEAVTGQAVPVRVGPRRPGDPAALCASPKKLMAELEWKPCHSSLEEIIASAWLWEKGRRSHADSRDPAASPRI